MLNHELDFRKIVITLTGSHTMALTVELGRRRNMHGEGAHVRLSLDFINSKFVNRYA